MERKRVVLGLMAALVAFGVSSTSFAQEKGGEGPYGLPSLAVVKDKVKPTDEELKKIEDIYAAATKAEADSKKNAKENGTDNKTMQGYLLQGKIETQNKVKEVLDKDKGKIYDDAVKASQPDKKKKK
jgi:hypothetical protein